MDIDAVIASHPFTLPPFPQQLEALKRSLAKRRFALFMDQGTGKTKVIIDTAAILFKRHVIDALLILAPNDVHAQWVNEQIPEHLIKSITARCVIWRAGKAKARREAEDLSKRARPNTLAVLAVNHEALATDAGHKLCIRFCTTYKVLCAVDESDLMIKTPRASRTRAMNNRISPLCVIRRILTGTPAATPFELYSQFKFLDEKILGFDSLIAFKHRYALWEKEYIKRPDKKTGKMVVQQYETLIDYQNLDELNARTAPFIYRVRKEDCTDLPPKLYSNRDTHLSAAQAKIYKELKDTGIALIKCREQGQLQTEAPIDIERLAELTEDELLARMQSQSMKTTAELKITLILRLQQVVGGFLTDDDRNTHCIDGTPDRCPRMQAALSIIDGALRSTGKIIVWAVYRAEMSALRDLCRAAFPDVQTVMVNGDVKGDARVQAIADFKSPATKTMIMVAHTRSVGTGQNFQVAQTLAYYSCNASSRDRMQSEDRAHRIGQKGTVSVYDLRTPEVPIDSNLAEIRKRKQDFNTMVMTWDSFALAQHL